MVTRPPLNALHVFCVVVREGGFRQAAQILCITPGAVSRQIQTLEAHLSQVLFERGNGGLATLTPAGRQLHERVADKLVAINAVLGNRNNSPRASILVDTSVTLAMHWLIPQLRLFTERYPGIHVEVRTGDGDADLTAPVDVFIRREVAELRSLPSHLLMTERSVLVSGPSFVPQPTPRDLNDMRWLRNATRLGARSRNDLWPIWCKFHELDAKALQPTLIFDNTVLAIQAAAQGLGILVVPEPFIKAMISSATLKLLSPAYVETGSYSYAIGRRRASARVTKFVEWLREISEL